MDNGVAEITRYTRADHDELLRLLLELHDAHFAATASLPIREMHREWNLSRSYNEYINFIEKSEEDTWLVLMARSAGDTVGFIIGSIENDPALLLGKMGKFEDWFVEPAHRGQGIGGRLYQELEQWFRAHHCQQIRSETWQGNDLSINAHLKGGFFISAVSFGKIL